MIGWWMTMALAVAGGPHGWRYGGDGHADVEVPENLGSVVWRRELPASSNASPVKLGDRVCFALEPTSVGCADAATGELLWTATNDVWDAVPEAQAKAVRATVEAAEQADARLEALQREYSRLRREARRPGSDSAARLAEVAKEMGTLREAADAAAEYRTEAVDQLIGWTSPSLLTDGSDLFVQVANGVVSRFGPDGTRRWSTWLGAPIRHMRGYLGLPTASPQWLGDGRVVVAHNRLVALDAATGEIAWESVKYLDFGTPAVASVGGLEVVVTPNGEVVRGRDGAVVAKDLATIWYNGPIVHDDVAYWVGTRAGDEDGFRGRAAAVRLARDGDAVTATPLWASDLDTRERFYASPVMWEGRLINVSRSGLLHVLDPATGSVVHRSALTDNRAEEVWASPLVLRGRMYIQFQRGRGLWFDDPSDWTPDQETRLEWGLTTPVFEDGVAWYRSAANLLRLGRAP